MSFEIEKPCLLVVEGKDDCLFFKALIGHLRFQNIQVMPPYEGKSRFRDYLDGLISAPDFKSKVAFLGIVRDANNDPRSAFQSVRDALSAKGLPAPTQPLLPAGNKPKVIVMILPDEHTPGMLEDLCLRTVEDNNDVIECVDRYFQCLQEHRIRLPHNMSKAKAQTFLASRRKAGLRVGEAAQAGYWPFNSSALGQARDFLRDIEASGSQRP